MKDNRAFEMDLPDVCTNLVWFYGKKQLEFRISCVLSALCWLPFTFLFSYGITGWLLPGVVVWLLRCSYLFLKVINNNNDALQQLHCDIDAALDDKDKQLRNLLQKMLDEKQ